MPSSFALTYVLIYAVPCLALIALALRYRVGADGNVYWYPEGHLLTAMTLYPCLFFICGAALASGHEGGLLGLTTQHLNEALEPMKSQMPGDTVVQLTAIMNIFTKFLPALLGTSWIFLALVSMVVAQVILQRQNWHLRTGFTLHELYTPSWLVYAVAVTGLAGVLAPAPFNYIGSNLAIILCIPFFLIGMAVIHVWAGMQKATKLILIALYLVISIFPAFVLIPVLMGVIDQWGNFRKRMTHQPKSSVN
jgi:hypothetical protein